MDKDLLKSYWQDLRCLTPFPKRYKPPEGKDSEFWRGVGRRYHNMEKTLDSSAARWYIITYNDGRRELARLRVLKGGLFSGLSPAIYRGLIIPRRVTTDTFAHIKTIEMAF